MKNLVYHLLPLPESPLGLFVALGMQLLEGLATWRILLLSTCSQVYALASEESASESHLVAS